MKKHLFLIPLLISLSALSCGTKRAIPNTATLEINDVEITNRHTDLQKTLLSQDEPSSYIKNHQEDFKKVGGELPQPYEIEITETNDTGDNPDYYEIELSEDNTFASSYNVRGNKLYNLKNGSYYYKVHSIHGDKEFVSDIKTINVTASSPRNIYIDGVINSRDLGGWNIGENRVYKQGMLYRTAQYNYSPYASDPFVSKPTEEGLKTVKEELKIKTDIDLRRLDETSGIRKSPLGDDVNYVSAPMYFGGQNIFTNSANKTSIQLFFTTLADESNYPIAFHCVRGTDRTGALAYALGALVGMSEDDLMMDYLFSDLANIKSLIYDTSITGNNFYVQGIRNSDGASLSEKAKNYLMTTCEIAETTLDTIIDILVD